MHAYCLQRPEKSFRSLGTGVTVVSPMWVLELNMGPLQEQPVFLTMNHLFSLGCSFICELVSISPSLSFCKTDSVFIAQAGLETHSIVFLPS